MSTSNATVAVVAVMLCAAALFALPGGAGPDRPIESEDRPRGEAPPRALRVVADLGPDASAALIPAAPGGAARLTVGPTVQPLVVAIDGGLAAVLRESLASAFENGVFGFDASLSVSDDRVAIENVLAGAAAAGLTTRPPSVREGKAGLGEEFVGWFVPVVVVHVANPVTSVTAMQARELLRGAVDDWAELGGDEGTIRRVLPPNGARADLFARALLPGDALGPATPSADPLERLRIVASDPRAATVIALPLADRIRVPRLAIDGVSPDAGAVRLGRYRFAIPVYLVTGRSGDARVPRLVETVRSGALARMVADVLVPAR